MGVPVPESRLPVPSSDPTRFVCTWQREGIAGASVRAVGRIDAAAVAVLEQHLREALAAARLVLVDLHATHGGHEAAARAIIDASELAREAGTRLLVIGAPPIGEAPPPGSNGSRPVAWLSAQPLEPATHAERRPENPVNAAILQGRVMAVEGPGLWLHGSDAALHHGWAPPSAPPTMLAGRSIELYVDATGALNGWMDPESGLAVNQRRLATEPPDVNASLHCQGRCGIRWRTPAPRALIEHGERCLTCAGPLAPA